MIPLSTLFDLLGVLVAIGAGAYTVLWLTRQWRNS